MADTGMTVTVRLFAGLREELGTGETTVEVAPGATVAGVWHALTGGDAIPGHVLVAVNLEYADARTPVSEGDEVGFFPPVTGG